tara:strand:- start:1994 stop:2254 length:261 start_codon:yes stop_codon:yes gene_type:complete
MELNKEELNDWEVLNKNQQIAVWGRLCAMRDLKEHIEVLQEVYTRLLVKNGIESDNAFSDCDLKKFCNIPTAEVETQTELEEVVVI